MQQSQQERLDRHQERYKKVEQVALGRWQYILERFNVDAIDPRILKRQNMPCPIDGCGGTDRFQYTDKYKAGNWHCRSCGSGGGIKLLMSLFGKSAGAIVREVEEILGVASSLPPPDSADRATDRHEVLIGQLLREARPVTKGDPVDQYLAGLGLDLEVYPASLLYHPALRYYEWDGKRTKHVGTYAGMLAKVQDLDGTVRSLHRTYLKDGQKAPVQFPKKTLFGANYEGASVFLGEPAEEMHVGEGLENSLAVLKRHERSTLAALDSGNLSILKLPDCVRHLRIYGDNDAHKEFAGQVAAYTLARQFVVSSKRVGFKRTAEVFIPKAAGSDWKLVFRKRVLPQAA